MWIDRLCEWVIVQESLNKTFVWTMGNRDPRYDLIKPMIIGGKIKTFNDIFKFIPKTVVAIDLGKKVNRFNGLMKRVQGFTLEDLFMIAQFCELEEAQILELAENQYQIDKSRIKKNKL